MARNLVPAEDRPQAQMPGRRRGARAHPPSAGKACCWPESFLPGIDEDSLAQLTEHALLTTLAQLDDLRRGRLQPASRHQRAGQRAVQAADRRDRRAEPAAVRALARPDPGGDRGPDRARHRAGAGDRRRAQGQRHHDRDRRFRRRLFLVLRACAICRSPSSSSTARSSRTARSTPPMPRSARPRSISRTASAARRWRKASRPWPTCRRWWSWAATSARAC